MSGEGHYDTAMRNGLLSLPLNALIHKIYELFRNPPVRVSDFRAILDAVQHQGNIGINDRLLFLEKLLHVMARLDTEDPELSEQIQQFVIGVLFKDLPHPSTGFLSAPPNITAVQAIQSDRPYAYRPADGSNYNPIAPTLGKADHPYARSVSSSHCTADWALPDATLVFDALLKRDKFVAHPGGISSLFFAFADLVIHDIFYTAADGLSNTTSSYLDLSILYGRSEAQVDSVRRKDGTGRLWDDVFADKRLLFMPPAACALLVLLSRNHNYVAQKILDINEHGNFSNPPPSDAQLCQAQDDEIFERTRLVNCGLFMHIILGDYVGAILGLVRDGYSWRLDPLMPTRDGNRGILSRGEGNVVAIEFNLLYSWHATLSQKDTEWTTSMIDHALARLGTETMTQEQFRKVVYQLGPTEDVKSWKFGGLERTESGSFKDADLANLIHNAIEWRAGAFKARGVPEALRFIEVMIIERARKWGTCTLNEFRKFIGLKPYKNFDEWNPDKEIATAAAALYHDIDNLELYVGLQAEETKSPGEGAGLCPGYTISRAILSDAVCLTRGDRFYTTDYTPANLTLWGFQDCQYDRKDGSFGGLLTKLLYRTLPDFFPPGSAYAHFPFLEPSWMHDHMIQNRNKEVKDYTWTRPPARETIVVEQYKQVVKALSDSAFTSNSEDRLYSIFGSLASVQSKKELIREVKAASFGIFGKSPAEYFAKKTSELIIDKTLKLGGKKQIDIVREVINALPAHWISDKTFVRVWATTDGFVDVGRYVYNNDGPVDDWHLRSNAREFVNARMSKKPSSKAEVTNAIAAVVTAPFFSKALAQIVDYYISENMQKERDEIIKLTKDNRTTDVMTYVKEALRHHPVISGINGTRLDGSTDSAQCIYVNIAKANLDSPDAPVITGFENTGFFTERFFEEAVSAVLSVVFGLGHVERAHGKRGRLHRFTETLMDAPKVMYTDSHGRVTPLPESMMIEYH